MIGIEIPMGTTVLINGKACIVVKQLSCDGCAIRDFVKRKNGLEIVCGYIKNESDFMCSNGDRSDNTSIIFKPIAK